MTAEITLPPTFPESTYPFAVQIALTLGSNIDLDLSESMVRLPFSTNLTLTITREHTDQREDANFIKRITVLLEAFPSISEAERAGKLLAVSLLWVATSKRVTIDFEKWADDLPFAIRNRNESAGASMRADGRVHFNLKPEDFCLTAEKTYGLQPDLPPAAFTSMNFYASARLENSDRARFIGLMIALEALSVQRVYDDEIKAVIDELASQLKTSPALAGDKMNSVRCSLYESAKNLCRESVRQAILRTVQQYVNNKDTVKFVDRAYRVRSKILHEGMRADEISSLTHQLEGVLREIYSAMLSLPLDRS